MTASMPAAVLPLKLFYHYNICALIIDVVLICGEAFYLFTKMMDAT